jgi:S-adenosylmethionine hydrolase
MITSPKQKKELAVSDQRENKTMIIAEILGCCGLGFIILNIICVCIKSIDEIKRELHKKEHQTTLIKEYNDTHQNNKTL